MLNPGDGVGHQRDSEAAVCPDGRGGKPLPAQVSQGLRDSKDGPVVCIERIGGAPVPDPSPLRERLGVAPEGRSGGFNRGSPKQLGRVDAVAATA